jgi:hypothetical protein
MNEITEIVVPADLVARSRPAGHSVPIIRAKRESRRAPWCRNLVIASVVAPVVALAVLAGLSMLIYHSFEPKREAGYHLVCQAVLTGGRGLREESVCHWEK